MKTLLLTLLTAALAAAQSAPPRVLGILTRPAGEVKEIVTQDNFGANNIIQVQIIGSTATAYTNIYVSSDPLNRRIWVSDSRTNTFNTGGHMFGQPGLIGFPLTVDAGAAKMAIVEGANGHPSSQELHISLPITYAEALQSAYLIVYNAQYRYILERFVCNAVDCRVTIATAARALESGTWADDASGTGRWLFDGLEWRKVETPGK